MKHNLSSILQGEVVFTALMEGEPLHTIQDGFFCGDPDYPCAKPLDDEFTSVAYDGFRLPTLA